MDKRLAPSNAATGVPGLDEILSGGFTKGALFLVEGNPGTGKTTLALRFLIEGAAEGERTLYITLSETRDELLSGSCVAWLDTRPQHRNFRVAASRKRCEC